MSPSAAPAMQSHGRCPQVPCLPRKTAAASRATDRPQVRNQSPAQPSAMLATQNEGGCRQVPRALGSAAASRATNGPQARQSYQSQPSAISAMPATQNEGRCRQVQVSHLPRKSAVASRATAPQARHQSQPSAIISAHACHAKRRGMSPSATPAMQSYGRCPQVPCPPRKSGAASRATNGPQARM